MSLTLKQARCVAEKTQQQLADFLGIHVQTYRKIEVKPEIATIKQAKDISRFLGISYNEIFFDSQSTKSRTDTETS